MPTAPTSMRFNPGQLQRLDKILQDMHPGLPRAALIRILIDNYIAEQETKKDTKEVEELIA